MNYEKAIAFCKKAEIKVKEKFDIDVFFHVADSPTTVLLISEKVVRSVFVLYGKNVADFDAVMLSRVQDCCNVKKTIAYVFRKYYRYSYQRIGDVLKKDHTNMIHLVQQAQTHLKFEEDFKSKVEAVLKELGIEN